MTRLNQIIIFLLSTMIIILIGIWAMEVQLQHHEIILDTNTSNGLLTTQQDKVNSSQGSASLIQPVYHYSEYIGLQHQHKQRRNMNNVQLEHLSEKNSSEISVSVLIDETKEKENISLEQYVLGVALAELPSTFHKEAIKAQMIAARTYILYQMQKSQNDHSMYDVTNTVRHQVYMQLTDVAAYAEEYPDYYDKFVQASEETEGLVMTYNGKLIEALYFSTSNGKTEAAEHVWGNKIEYLQSVSSPWDRELSPKFKSELTMTVDELFERLNLSGNQSRKKVKISKLVRNESGRVHTVNIQDKQYSGIELREKLGLSSTDFKWTINSKEQVITFTAYGYGHGVGMSQWGAEGFAQQGIEAKSILEHYYKGITLMVFSKNQ